MRGPGARFRPTARLRSSRDYHRVGARGRRRASRYFIVLMAGPGPDRQDPGPRIGITVSRKVGNAVVRNQVKRRVREWFRHSRARLAMDMDLVVIARPPAAGLDGPAVGADLDALLGLTVAEETGAP